MKLQEELKDYDENLQRTITELHSENQSLRRQMKLPMTPLVLLPRHADLQTPSVKASSTVNIPGELRGDQSVEIPDSCETSEVGSGKESPINFSEQTQAGSQILAGGRRFSLHNDWCLDDTPDTHGNRPAYNRSLSKVAEDYTSKKYGLLHPTGSFAVTWSAIFMAILLYEVLVWPLTAYPIPNEGFLTLMSWIGIIFWTSDLFISMLMGYQTKSGEFVLSARLVIKHYAKTWFIPDLVVIILDWVTIIVDDPSGTSFSFIKAGKMIRSLRIMRALRFLRLHKVRTLFRIVEQQISSEYVLILSSIMVNLLAILVCSHFIGCLWYWVGTQEHDKSWVKMYLSGKTWRYSYLTSYHWALTQFTPGSMDVQPQNTLERCFANVILMMGLILFSSIVSSITNATNRLRTLHSTYTTQMWQLRKFFRQESISASLLIRVTKYVDTVIAPRFDRVNMHDVVLLKLLPHSIHSEVISEIYDKHFSLHPFFAAYSVLDSTGMHSIYKNLTQIALADNDMLFSPGQKASSMYCIITGNFEYSLRLPHVDQPISVCPGMWCSEAALWTHWLHQGVMQSTMAADIVAIGAELFRVEMKKQKHMSFVMTYGTRFVESMNDMLEFGMGDTPGSENGLQSQKPRFLSDLHTPPSAPSEAPDVQQSPSISNRDSSRSRL